MIRITIIAIFRLTALGFILYKVWHEVGTWTWVLLLLISVGNELRDFNIFIKDELDSYSELNQNEDD